MSNRLDDQSPRTDWPAVPPIGPDELEFYLRRGRQLRAKAFAEGLKLTARALARAFGDRSSRQGDPRWLAALGKRSGRPH
jgi:hypothetical protein